MNREFDQNSDSQEIRICSKADGFMRVGMKDPKLNRLFSAEYQLANDRLNYLYSDYNSYS